MKKSDPILPLNHVHNLFLIGSGFTRAVFPAAPLNDDLVRELMKARPDAPVRAYHERYETVDMEVLLTRLDLEISRLTKDDPYSAARRRLKADRKAIDFAMASYFEQFRFGRVRCPRIMYQMS